MARRLLAYGKDVAERRRSGQRIGLLVVVLHDWDAGLWFDGKPEVARVVLPADLAVADADWSLVMALDVLVCGSAKDDVFYAACDALEQAGAASIWGYVNNGFWLLKRAYKQWLPMPRIDSYKEQPVPINELSAYLKKFREISIMLRHDFYASRIFDDARRALAAQTFGVTA